MDFAFGLVFSSLRSHAKGGSTANCESIANRVTDDIIILGSSRATHHYVPQIIEDSLGVSCYNCGEEGNGIVLAYGRFKMLVSRFKPKLIIYEMTPGYDFGTSEPNTKYLGYLRPYYDKEGIKQIFDVFDNKFSSIKMRSQMYRNTDKLLPNVVDNIIYRDNKKGYSPLYGRIDTKKLSEDSKIAKQEVDSIKLFYVERLIIDAKAYGIPIIFMISPRFGGNNNTSKYEPEIELCKEYGIHYYNYINNKACANNADYFQDEGHMNNDGAEVFTRLVVNDVISKYF